MSSKIIQETIDIKNLFFRFLFSFILIFISIVIYIIKIESIIIIILIIIIGTITFILKCNKELLEYHHRNHENDPYDIRLIVLDPILCFIIWIIYELILRILIGSEFIILSNYIIFFFSMIKILVLLLLFIFIEKYIFIKITITWYINTCLICLFLFPSINEIDYLELRITIFIKVILYIILFFEMFLYFNFLKIPIYKPRNKMTALIEEAYYNILLFTTTNWIFYINNIFLIFSIPQILYYLIRVVTIKTELQPHKSQFLDLIIPSNNVTKKNEPTKKKRNTKTVMDDVNDQIVITNKLTKKVYESMNKDNKSAKVKKEKKEKKVKDNDNDLESKDLDEIVISNDESVLSLEE
jgi:hypothetical protein